MSPETARLVFTLAFAAGVVTWLVGILFHRRTFRGLEAGRDPAVSGEVDVPASPADVQNRLVRALRGGLAGFGPVLLTEVADSRVAGALALVGRPADSPRAMRFAVELRDAAGATSAAFRVQGLPAAWMRTASAVCVYVLTPAVLILVGYLIPRHVLSSDSESVRAQAVQTAQIIHFLWPPFLFCGLSRYLRRVVDSLFRNLLRNTAF